MSDKISRRDFLKLTSLGAAAATVLTGCGPTSRYVKRQPYGEMPEYTLTGKSTYFATTCGECPAGCGLVVRTMEGRAHKIEGNPLHPLNQGKTCARGQAALQGLYNPDRLKGPVKQAQRGSGNFEPLKWDDGLNVIAEALKNPSDEIVFILGLYPDHLYDFVKLLGAAHGNSAVYRLSALGMFDKRVTLADAAQKVYGVSKIPYFQLANLTFSFGANFLETWISPVAYGRDYGKMRQGTPGQRGYLVQFEARMSQTAASADEWIPITPGSEALVAKALGRLAAANLQGDIPLAFREVDISAVAAASGVSTADLMRLAKMFAAAPQRVAIPGGGALAHTHGVSAAEAILALNVLVDNLGKPGGVFFAPDAPVQTMIPGRSSTLAELGALVARMNSGQVKTVLIHGVNPAFEVVKSLGLDQALARVPTVISFSPFLNETTLLTSHVLPDHTPLESFGYQRVQAGSDRLALSAAQPVVVPLYDTRSTVDVLLAAANLAGAPLSEVLKFDDEVDFLQKAIQPLITLPGIYTALEAQTFWTRWLQTGGWWPKNPGLERPTTRFDLDQPLEIGTAAFTGAEGDYPFYLVPFPHPLLGDGSAANRPTLQETPDPMTTAMWNTWVQINPATARKLGLQNDDVVKITSPAGEIEAIVYLYPAIHPQVIAVPFGQGHTAYGRYADGRGTNPLDLLGAQQTEAGELAYLATRVKIAPSGKRRPLARYESETGVYGKRND